MRALLLTLAMLTGCAWAEAWPEPDWPIDNTPLDWQAVDAYAFPARPSAERSGIRTDALLIIRDGRILYERYAAPTSAATAHLTWSISKSVLATLLGVAHGEGRFQLQDPVSRFYPAMQAHPGVRMADLLHWASGLDWQEDYEYAPLKSSVVAMLYTRGREDMAAYTAAREAVASPGQRFRYSSGDSNLLAATLRGMLDAGQYHDYPWQALFTPLGIDSAVWERDRAGTYRGLVLPVPQRSRPGADRPADAARWALAGSAIAAQALGGLQPHVVCQSRSTARRGQPRWPLVAQPAAGRRCTALAECAGRHLCSPWPLGPGAVRAAHAKAGDRALRR
ncbi:serine hydrolase [Pseudomonas putida]|nr:serine hydrolase [Pseudomonas putida]